MPSAIHHENTDSELVRHVVCLFAHQLSLSLILSTRRLIKYQDDANATRNRERSPIPVVIGPDVR